AETKLRHFFDKIAKADPKLDRIGSLLQDLQPMLDGLDRDALIQKLVWLEFERLFHYYSLQNDAEMQSSASSSASPGNNGERARREYAEDLPGIQINLGIKDGFYKASMLQFLLDHSGLQKADLGKIILGDAWTSIEGEQASLDQLKSSFDGARFRGRGLKVTAKQAGRGGDKPAYAGPRRGSQGRPPFQRNHNR
ncbi:MAG: DbpA RNA binding domain-containing protein, partial [Bacteroidota bacterium]